jgi:23S rRNA pseudouridine1911/1915/1917 synthase
LLVAARSAYAFERATLALKRSFWQKTYLALVRSTDLPERGRIEGKLEPSPEDPRRVRAVTGVSLRPAPADVLSTARLGPYVTTYETLDQRGALRQVSIRVGPAFRHQIRAHFAALGAPLLNDTLYGAPGESVLDVGRHALHAARVAWEGEADLPGFDVTEPLAADLMTLFNNEGL